MNFFLIGYFPKQRVTRGNWHALRKDDAIFSAAPSPVEQLCSVSNCIVKALVGFDYPDISMNSFNQYGGFNQIETALGLMSKEHPCRIRSLCLWDT